MAVHVSATFKKDERESNGLEAIRQQLIDQPLTRHVIVATIETTQIVTDVRDGGVKTPRVRLVNVEALDGDHAVIAQKLLNEQFAARTGQSAPPPTLFDEDAQIAPAIEVDGDQADGEQVTPPDVDPGDVDAAGKWPGDDGYVEPSAAFSDPDVAGPVAETGKARSRPRR